MSHDPIQSILVNGAAGFIGSALRLRLLREGARVVGVDNLNADYEVALKEARVQHIREAHPQFELHRIDIAESRGLEGLFRHNRFDAVVNLAAQAGVRYSTQAPEKYVQTNLVGFANLLECCRRAQIRHLVFASSSSVYGANARLPYAEHDNVDHPLSLYAASKKANELMAHSYAHLYGLPCTGLRFFTAYGPWGRPDMAYFSFTRKILAGESIPVFNRGRMQRDFTYIDDIVEGVVRVIQRPPSGDPDWNAKAPNSATSDAPYRIYNIGNQNPVDLSEFIRILENCLGRRARVKLLQMQAGDVVATAADTRALEQAVGYAPDTPLQVGLEHFVRWYRGYYRVP